MMVPPLSERPVTEEDEEQFRRESTPRTYTLRERWSDYRADVKRNRPKGAKARFRAWMDADAVDWGIRVAVVFLFIGGSYSLYINGVAYGWWHAWGEKPTIAATTTPTARPSPSASSEPAMSGGYEIGPDGVLVRPAEHAASTYTKPELPEEAKENTERGAEAAAEHYLAMATYAWNTGDATGLKALSDEGSGFAKSLIQQIESDYDGGWTYGHSLTLNKLLMLEPVPPNGADVPPGTVGVKFSAVATDGTKCVGRRIIIRDKEYEVTISILMTWRDGAWIETQGRSEINE